MVNVKKFKLKLPKPKLTLHYPDLKAEVARFKETRLRLENELQTLKELQKVRRALQEFQEFQRVFRENTVTLIISAFGVVAALSWNETLKAAMNMIFPEKGDLIVKLYTAVAITIVSIFVTYLLSKMKISK